MGKGENAAFILLSANAFYLVLRKHLKTLWEKNEENVDNQVANNHLSKLGQNTRFYTDKN